MKESDIVMIRVEGGDFQRGQNDPNIGGNDLTIDEQPEHGVSLTTFYISKYPITNAQYLDFMNEYGSNTVKEGQYAGKVMVYEGEWGLQVKGNDWTVQEGYENHPVIWVTWYGANAFCEWVDGKLPTESEWEFAAHGGNKQKQKYRYSGSDEIEEVAWYHQNAYISESDHNTFGTQGVGQKKQNDLGIYDMSGNVWEWCQDWYQPYPETHQNNPQGPHEGSEKVLRGGSWRDYAHFARTANRHKDLPHYRNKAIGFRLAKTL